MWLEVFLFKNLANIFNRLWTLLPFLSVPDFPFKNRHCESECLKSFSFNFEMFQYFLVYFDINWAQFGHKNLSLYLIFDRGFLISIYLNKTVVS